MFPFFSPYFYYPVIALQAICAIHCVRNGKQQKWIYLIIFLPAIGSIAYLFTEVFTRKQIGNVQSGMGSIIRPSGHIKKLEERLRFSDTFNNKIMLADAYHAAGQTDRAIELYESSLTGTFTENELVLTQLIYAYYEKQQWQDIVDTAKKLYKLPQFARSRAHTIYAIALGKIAQPALAEQEFKTMLGRYSNFENRYCYGVFLQDEGRHAEARELFATMVDEGAHLSGHERSNNRQWIGRAKDAMRKAK